MYNILYHPHIGEVFPLMLGLREKFKSVPGLDERSIKAEQMLLNHNIFWHDGWHIKSQSKSTAYRVDGSCECPDSGVNLNGHIYCKHKIAVHIYRKILTTLLNALSNHRIQIDKEFNAKWCNKKSHFVLPNKKSEFKFSQWLAIDGGKHEGIKSQINAELRAGSRVAGVVIGGSHE